LIQDWWIPAAQRGYPEAQFWLAKIYEALQMPEQCGQEFSPEYWYRRAELQGHYQAKLNAIIMSLDDKVCK